MKHKGREKVGEAHVKHKGREKWVGGSCETQGEGEGGGRLM